MSVNPLKSEEQLQQNKSRRVTKVHCFFPLLCNYPHYNRHTVFLQYDVGSYYQEMKCIPFCIGLNCFVPNMIDVMDTYMVGNYFRRWTDVPVWLQQPCSPPWESLLSSFFLILMVTLTFSKSPSLHSHVWMHLVAAMFLADQSLAWINNSLSYLKHNKRTKGTNLKEKHTHILEHLPLNQV